MLICVRRDTERDVDEEKAVMLIGVGSEQDVDQERVSGEAFPSVA